MRYHQISQTGDYQLVAETADGYYDLTSAKDGLTFRGLAEAADISNESIEAITARLVDDATEIEPEHVSEHRTSPVQPDEVWAAGVTYEISEEARKEESGMPDVYIDVYDGDRPELFFKATPNRTVGPNEAVGIRGDSDWDVPEPELAIVIHRGDIVGFTVGNDMSSRSIEGENPLYLPQAKVYDRCCSIGPAIVDANNIDPHDLEMLMTITRDDEAVFEDSTSTGEMARTCEELVDYYTKHSPVPDSAVLLTGTSLVPSDDFTLHEGDTVAITIEEIGTLENDVIQV